MAQIADIVGKTVYLDTNIFIYAVEGYEPEKDFIRELFITLDRGYFTAVTSELTLTELLVKPFQLGRNDVIAVYTDLIQHSDRLTVMPVERSILIESARQRAALGLRMPDAIHVATALISTCDVFLTNDHTLKLPPALTRQVL